MSRPVQPGPIGADPARGDHHTIQHVTWALIARPWISAVSATDSVNGVDPSDTHAAAVDAAGSAVHDGRRAA